MWSLFVSWIGQQLSNDTQYRLFHTVSSFFLNRKTIMLAIGTNIDHIHCHYIKLKVEMLHSSYGFFSLDNKTKQFHKMQNFCRNFYTMETPSCNAILKSSFRFINTRFYKFSQGLKTMTSFLRW